MHAIREALDVTRKKRARVVQDKMVPVKILLFIFFKVWIGLKKNVILFRGLVGKREIGS